MGLMNFLLKKGMKENVKIIIRDYLAVKDQNMGSDERALFALVLDARHSYQRSDSNSMVFNYKNLEIDVSRFKSITHLLACVIIAEQADLNLSSSQQKRLDSMLNDVITEQLQKAGITSS
jgi:hypothetical protein